MTNRKLICFCYFALTAALAWAASSHSLNLPKPAVVNGTEIKAGDYKVELNGTKVTIKNKHASVEAEVSVETLPSKTYQSTACCLGEDGKYKLQEIRLGGTATKLVFK